jgi:hypothetical protein
MSGTRDTSGQSWSIVERSVTILAGLGGLATAVIAALLIFWPGIRRDPPPAKLAADISKIAVAPDVSLRAFYEDLGRTDLLKATADQLRPAIAATDAPVSRVGLPPPSEAGPGRSQATELRDVAQTFLGSRGVVVYAELVAEGFKHRPSSVRGQIYLAKTRVPARSQPIAARVQNPELERAIVAIGRQLSGDYIARAASDQVSVRIWIPLPITERPVGSRVTSYFVRVELYDATGRLLTFADSTPFRQAVV